MSYDIREVKLKDISIGKGSYGIGASAVDYDSKLPTYLRITDIDDFGNIDYENLKSIDDEKVDQYYLKENDIVFARTGASTGRTYFYEKKHGNFVYAGFLIKFSLNPDIVVPKYMKYYTLSDSYKNWVKAFTGGSTRGNINANTYGNMVVNLPSVEQQNYLVDILSSLDDKIELNNKINQNLETLAQTLYKHWFVDFEFPNENGEPYKSSGGEVIDSEIGTIPKGWEFKKIDEISNLQIGRTPSRKEKEWFSHNPSNVKWYSIKDMGNSGLYIDSPSEFLTHDAVRKFNIPIVEANTILLSFKLTIGRLAITTSECTTNEAIAHMNNLKENINTNYLYLFLKNFNYETLGNTSSIATAVNSKTIKNIKVLIPYENTLSKFTSATDQIFNQIKNLQFQNQNLLRARDELLPKLMNSEIEVPV